MILVLDNYDSFTYNLVQYLGQIDSNIKVFRNDEVTLNEVTELKPSRIIISPGPGRPEDTGIVPDVIDKFSKKEVPILGVCLGHQAIGCVFGAEVIKADRLMHGKISTINHDEVGIYEGLSQNFEATRYHSLIIDKDSVPVFLKVTANTDEGEIMGIRHCHYPVEGVQFHPESIKTFEGQKLLYNFVKEGANYYERSVGN